MKIILISAALDNELRPLLKVADVQKKTINNVNIWEGNLFGKKVVIYQTNVSRTNAAYSTGIVINEYKAHELVLLNVGSSGAGTINEKVFDTVIADKLFYREPEVPGYKIGQVPHFPQFFQSDRKYFKILKVKLESNQNVHFGNFLCSEKFMFNEKIHNESVNKFKNIKSVDMESTAIAHLAYINKLPFIGIRTISDNIYEKEKPMDQFDKTIKLVGKEYLKIVKEIISDL